VRGLIQAENFDEGGQGIAYYDTTAGNSGGAYRTTDVDIEASTDGANDYNVSKTRVGEWLQYTINVAAAGDYTFEARVANIGSGASFAAEIDGAPLPPMNVPNTGGWQAWQTIKMTGTVPLTAGTHVLRIALTNAGTSGGVGNYNWFRLVAGTAPPPTNPAYGGTPAAIPGTFQAENFDEGGEGVACHDTTAGNSRGAYRTTDVDIETCSEGPNEFDVAKTRVGEWLNYTVNVAATGNYTFEARVANVGTGASFGLVVDGTPVQGAVDVPATGGWQIWATTAPFGMSLTGGQHVIRVVFLSASSGGGAGNYNWFRLVAGSTPPPSNPAYGGTPAAIPGLFQAENFDVGGEGVAYHDTTAGNAYAADGYRTTESVDIEKWDDVNNGFNVGKTRVGEWLTYTVNIATGGTYTLEASVADTGAGATFRLDVDGTPATSAIAVPATGGWHVWQTVTRENISLPAGQHVIRIVFLTTSSSGGAGNYDWFRLSR
jgi:hypothetical protein